MSIYKYTNPHPKGLDTTDCVVRAIAIAFDSDYLETRKLLNRKKRELEFSSYKATQFIYKYLEDYERIKFKVDKGVKRINAVDFAKVYYEGTFIVKMAKHIVCIKNGLILDTWDSSDKTIYTAWKIT